MPLYLRGSFSLRLRLLLRSPSETVRFGGRQPLSSTSFWRVERLRFGSSPPAFSSLPSGFFLCFRLAAFAGLPASIRSFSFFDVVRRALFARSVSA